MRVLSRGGVAVSVLVVGGADTLSAELSVGCVTAAVADAVPELVEGTLLVETTAGATATLACPNLHA